MIVSFGSNFTQRNFTWTQWKANYATKGLPFQYEENTDIYTIWTYDNQEILLCQIWRNLIPQSSSIIQEQNDSDKTDFETNYKSSGNTPLGQIDTDGANVVRIKAAKRGWNFWAIPIEITTSSLLGDMYCKDSNGTDIPGISCKIYDSNNDEITTAGALNVNLNTCIKTVIDFEPQFNYEIIGGSLRINSNPAQDIRLWIIGAPDIPAQYGGSKEFTSGVNLKFLSADSTFEVDGRVTKSLTYNSSTHEGKMRLIFKHPAGTQVNLQILIEIYRQ